MALELGGELLTLWLRFGETQVKDATATSYHLAGKEAKDLAGVTQLSRLRAMCLIFLAPVRAELWVPALLRMGACGYTADSLTFLFRAPRPLLGRLLYLVLCLRGS